MSQTDPPTQKKSPRRTVPRRSSTATSLQSLKRRLQTLRDYRDRTLTHRAGDVELSLESIIFDAMMARPASGDGIADSGDAESIQQSLEHIQAALDQNLLRFAEKAATGSVPAPADDGERDRLRRQVEELTAELAAVRQLILVPSDGDDGGRPVEVDRQLELLQEQLIHERQTVVELRLRLDDLNAAVADRARMPQQPKAALSWDEQKALLLAQLECEDESHALDPQQRMDVQQIIARTQIEIDRRDAEIVELRRLLTEQATAGSSVAIGAAAVAELLDHDDLIKEERENLRRLQEQFQKRLREAEVELSIERAKLARQRTELEEQQHTLQRQQESAPSRGEETHGKGTSRWLTRLGLSEAPETDGQG